jgi:hypothetical protein
MRPQVQNYTRLVTQKAWAAWRKLPPQPRRWVDLEDLIQDGLLFAKSNVVPKFRPHRANFTTFLSICLDQFYSRQLAAYFTAKRNKCQLVSVDAVMYRLFENDELEQEVQSVEIIKKLSSVASPTLRHSLKNWLLLKGKIHFHSERFSDAKIEMQALSKRYGFTRQDMEFLLNHETWRRGVDLHLDR